MMQQDNGASLTRRLGLYALGYFVGYTIGHSFHEDLHWTVLLLEGLSEVCAKVLNCAPALV